MLAPTRNHVLIKTLFVLTTVAVCLPAAASAQSPSFNSPVAYVTGAIGFDFASGDLNKDGNVDIVVTTLNDSSLSTTGATLLHNWCHPTLNQAALTNTQKEI